MAKSYIKAEAFTPIKDNVFVTELDSGPSITSGGIIIPDDNMKERGIRPRWGKCFSVGPDVDPEDVKPGDYILVEHGKWTNGIDIEIAGEMHRMWRIDYPASVILVSDEDPRDHQPTDFATHTKSTLLQIKNKLHTF